MVVYSVCVRRGKGGIVRGLGMSGAFYSSAELKKKREQEEKKITRFSVNRRSWQFVLDHDGADGLGERLCVG